MTKMRTPLTGLLALVMMALTAHVAAAAVFGRYPNAGCPDTLTIKQLKDQLDIVGPCNPQDGLTYALAAGAPADTVLGVGGIITAFDEVPTGFDIFIQMTGGGPNTGIDVFTHGTNFRQPYGFQLGDSVVVEWAGVADFQGDKELASPNNNFSNPDIVLRKVNSGNALPPFFTGTTTDFRELPTNATFAPYVSALVHLNGPLRVARNSFTPGLSFNSMLVVSDAAPSDSVFIDFAKFTNIVPPAVGTIINSIQGVGNKATRGFRIMPRDGDDISDNVPPSISDAYAVADNMYRVTFDRSVTSATATNTANYTLGSFGTVNAAVMDGVSAAILTVSGTGLSHGQSESVQVNGITGVSNGQTMSVPQQRTFLAGVLSCGEMAQPNPDTLATGSGGVPCVDKPLYSGPGGEFLNGAFGPRSTVTGIIVAKFGNLYYMEDGTQDPAVNQINSRGITVFAPPQNLVAGHRYLIAGACQDFWQETEFAGIQYIQDLGAVTVPTAWLSLTPDIMALGDPCDATQTQLTPRDYLTTLVRMTGLKVVAKQVAPNTPGQRVLTGNNGFWVAGPAPTYPDTFIVENLNTALGTNSSTNPNYPPLNTTMNLTGLVHFTNNPASPNNANNAKTFRIVPRSPSDIGPANVGVGDMGPATLSFAAYPNPGKTVNLSFSLARSTKVELAVYDLLGRKVVTLAKGVYDAGNYQKAWNRTDGAGNKVGSGVYFYRLRAGDEVRTARTLLLSD